MFGNVSNGISASRQSVAIDAAAKSAMVSRSQATWLCERRCASSTDAKVLRSATLSISAARFGAPSPKFFRTMCSK